MTPAELPLLQFEISILSPLVRITDPAEVQVGLHGLHIAQRGLRGLLLPQVATEYGWDRETFLSHACLKAGLSGDAWRHGAEMHIFTVGSLLGWPPDRGSDALTPNQERPPAGNCLARVGGFW